MPNKFLLFSGSDSDNTIYLTFDDGPHQGYTEKLLEILKHYNVKASFFVTGDHVNKYREILSNIISEGHDVYNHAYSHWQFEALSTTEQVQDIKKLDELLPKMQHQPVPLAFRPPRGRMSLSLLVRLIVSGRQIIYWSIDSKDYNQLGKEQLIERFERQPVKSGDIILFHDDNSFTIDALPSLIENWKISGFSIQPISHLARS